MLRCEPIHSHTRGEVYVGVFLFISIQEREILRSLANYTSPAFCGDPVDWCLLCLEKSKWWLTGLQWDQEEISIPPSHPKSLEQRVSYYFPRTRHGSWRETSGRGLLSFCPKRPLGEPTGPTPPGRSRGRCRIPPGCGRHREEFAITREMSGEWLAGRRIFFKESTKAVMIESALSQEHWGSIETVAPGK